MKQMMVQYVAFLRGINVGGSKPMKMEALREAFESLDLHDVRTVLASGNVLFSAPRMDPRALARQLQETLKRKFGHEIGVILRTIRHVRDLVDSDPFEAVTVTHETRIYVTFLAQKPETGMKIPYESPEGDLKILSVSTGEVCSVLTLSPGRGTTDLMNFLEKEFGRELTTRNWNTIVKVAEASRASSGI